MSLLHSFYCWGAVGVILGSTLFFSLFGTGTWRILAGIWALIPLYNIYNFATCPIEPIVADGKSMTISELFKRKIFWAFILLMIWRGAAEASIAQWASAFAESALHVSKTVGDLAGPCGFAVFMGISRALYGKAGGRIDLTAFMMLSAALCLVCYLVAGLANIPMLGLVGCMLCGFAVGIMWPGSISISSSILPSRRHSHVCPAGVGRRHGSLHGPRAGRNSVADCRGQFAGGHPGRRRLPRGFSHLCVAGQKMETGKATPASLMPRAQMPQTKSRKTESFPCSFAYASREKRQSLHRFNFLSLNGSIAFS